MRLPCHPGFHGEFRECEFPLEELEALEKTLKAISIPLGLSVGAFVGGSGLIRIYHACEGWVDFFYRNIIRFFEPDWQKHVLASGGYLELGMFDDAALALEEIEPEDKTRTEVLGACVVRVHPAGEFVAAFPNGAVRISRWPWVKETSGT